MKPSFKVIIYATLIAHAWGCFVLYRDHAHDPAYFQVIAGMVMIQIAILSGEKVLTILADMLKSLIELRFGKSQTVTETTQVQRQVVSNPETAADKGDAEK